MSENLAPDSFLGRGWAFPPRFAGRGAVMVAAAPPQVNPELAGLIVKMSVDSFPEGASMSDFLSSLRLDLNKPKLSKAGVGRVLTSLHRDGKIRREGKGPATRYFPSSMP